MGWDLLSGKTTARRKLMKLLWTSKSQLYRLEESSLYGDQSDEVVFCYLNLFFLLYNYIYGEKFCKEQFLIFFTDIVRGTFM